MNILYFATHEVLEYDDLRMFTDAGHRVFSVGGFADPAAPPPALRPRLPAFSHPGDWDMFVATGGDLVEKTVSPDFARRFDVAIVNHDPGLITRNQAALADLPVIYRSIGQSTRASEDLLARLDRPVTIVRYSARERGLPGFSRTDAVIYFGKYLDEFPAWTGGDRVISFHNSYPTRDGVCVPALAAYLDIARSLPLDLYGFANEGLACARGLAPPLVQLALFQTSAAYLYVYSVPPSYTLSLVEAMAVGLPVVVPSAEMVAQTLGAVGEMLDFSPARYEVPELLGHDPAFVAVDGPDLMRKIRHLSHDADAAAAASAYLRAQARKMFDVNRISAQWDEVLAAVAPAAKPTDVTYAT